jgi:hypothetical protein
VTRRNVFYLPDGKTTTRATSYISAWRMLARPFVETLGWRLHAFDPDLQFVVRGKLLDLPVGVARELGAHLKPPHGAEVGR